VAEVVIVESPAVAGEIIAQSLRELIEESPAAVLGLATGSTPMPIYRALALNLAADPLDMSAVRVFSLDEYVGLPSGHRESYHSVIARDVTVPLGLSPANVRVPNVDVAALQGSGAEYERAIRVAGGVDIQILGIGRTGHLGFNEPGSSLASLTRLKTLAPETRADNARFFSSPEEVPLHCVTQGLGTILRARHLILLATGEQKADAIAAAVEGPLTVSQPASVIQLHPHVTVVLDEAAASRLVNADYYRHAWANRPSWARI